MGRSQSLLIVAAAALCLGGCGGENTAGEQRSEPDAGAPQESAVTRAAKDMTVAATEAMEGIKSNETLPVLPKMDERLVIVASDGTNWSGLLTNDNLYFRSSTHAGWYRGAYSSSGVGTIRRLQLLDRPSILTLSEDACQDPALAPAYPQGVRFAHDGASHQGCAGPVRTPSGLTNTQWLVLKANAVAAPTGTGPVTTLLFGKDGGIGGTIACNDGGPLGLKWAEDGSFTRKGDEQGVIQTAMGCNDAEAVRFGETVFNFLGHATAWSRDGTRLTINVKNANPIEAAYLGPYLPPRPETD